jgi:hypothetical protein
MALTQPSEKQMEKIEKYEERLEHFNSQEGRAKAQIIISVSESMALILKKDPTAKEMCDRLIAEVRKKPKIVLTNLQRQLCSIKCSKEDDLCEYLDKVEDLYAYLRNGSNGHRGRIYRNYFIIPATFL